MENAPKLFFVSALFVAITTVLSELQFRLPGTSAAFERFLERVSEGEIPSLSMLYSGLRPYGLALAAVLMLMLPVLNAGYMSYCMKICRGQGAEYKDILDGFLYFGKILLIFIVTSVLAFLWSLLLIIPGIVARYRYRQAYYILLDDPSKGVFQCIRESKQLMAGRKLDLFLLDFSFLGWYIANFIVILLLPLPFLFPIVSVWQTPYMGLAQTRYYDTLISNLVA